MSKNRQKALRSLHVLLHDTKIYFMYSFAVYNITEQRVKYLMNEYQIINFQIYRIILPSQISSIYGSLSIGNTSHFVTPNYDPIDFDSRKLQHVDIKYN